MSFTVQNISKSYGAQPVLRQVSFELAPQKCLSILGKSGSGKSTLLKILAGLEPADSGAFLYQQTNLGALPSRKRGVVYLFQEALLFPYLNVFENIAFGLRLKKKSKSEIKTAVLEMAAALGLNGLEERMPEELSGGQKQRVAFGRALIVHPRLLLLDEPFGALDAHTRKEMQQLFLQVSQKEAITSIFVTHDPKEALVVGDQRALMQDGKLKLYTSEAEFLKDEQTGLPQEIAFWHERQAQNN